MKTLFTFCAMALLSISCIIQEIPGFEPGPGSTDDTGDTGGGEESGELWCSYAEEAMVWHNGQLVPEEHGGPWVKDEADRWVPGCACVGPLTDAALHSYDEQSDGQVDGWVVIPDDHPFVDLRDEIHTRTIINCTKRALELAEVFFCANFCGNPYNYDWDDFAALTEDTCADVVQSTTPIHALSRDVCVIGEYNPLPEY